jgi:argininosuccinate lyase
VAMAAEAGIALHEVPLSDMKKIESRITKDIFGVLSVEKSVQSRASFGGTAPKNVREQARKWLSRLEKERL